MGLSKPRLVVKNEKEPTKRFGGNVKTYYLCPHDREEGRGGNPQRRLSQAVGENHEARRQGQEGRRQARHQPRPHPDSGGDVAPAAHCRDDDAPRLQPGAGAHPREHRREPAEHPAGNAQRRHLAPARYLPQRRARRGRPHAHQDAVQGAGGQSEPLPAAAQLAEDARLHPRGDTLQDAGGPQIYQGDQPLRRLYPRGQQLLEVCHPQDRPYRGRAPRLIRFRLPPPGQADCLRM